MDETADRERWRRVDAILDAVLDLEPAARAARVAEACGSDERLRQEIEELLRAQTASSAFLATPAAEYAAPLVAAIDRELTSRPHPWLLGRTVGRYRLVRELGEGGMGIVYLAERIDGQFEQQVAIKLAKQGLHGEEARRRFLQERQILARLEHPAIARLLDGGVTDEGTPYFVMERVDGQPVTSYGAAHALPIDARLRLFLEICGAVQYAHRNLIVHRDLKPSNILVDDEGRVKLLDFGIAKLLGDTESSRESPRTIDRALTPEYAAPEQLSGGSISTSTDVYALGVLLYELLGGHRPYVVADGGVHALERAILEQEPAPPSTRVEKGDVRRRLRGDLDRIVLKALQKSPERRYQSAEAFASDVRRHLDGLPVLARGDAFSYRARKFLARHLVGVGVAALLVVTLAGGLVATTWQARRAEREARKAEAVKEFLKTLFSAADPLVAQGREPSVRQLLDAGAGRIETELAGQPDVQSEVAWLIAGVYQSLGEYDRAVPLLRLDLDRRRRLDGPHSLAVAQILRQLADASYEQGRYDEAGAMYRSALDIEREKRGGRTPQVAELLWDLGGVTRNRGDLAGAETLDKDALAIYTATKGDDSAESAGVRESLAIVYNQAARFADAAALERPVLAWRQQHLGPDHPHTLTAGYNLAYYLQALGEFDAAVGLAEDVAARQRRVLGGRHDALATSLRLLARASDGAGRAEAAVGPIAEALAIHSDRFGRDHVQIAHDRVWQALIEAHTGRLAEAERDAREALRIFDAQQGPPRADLPTVYVTLALVLAETGRLDDAEAVVTRTVSDLRARHQEGLFLGLALDAHSDIARRRGQPARARDLARAALPLVERGLGGDHPSTALARVHAGAAEWLAGDAATGEPLVRAGVARLEQQFPGGHPDLASTSFILGDLLRESGRATEARPLLQTVIDWRQLHFGPDDPRTTAARHALSLSKP